MSFSNKQSDAQYHRQLRKQTWWAALFFLAVNNVHHANAADVAYLKDIKPLLKNKCWSCHGPLKQEGGLRLDTGELLRTGGDTGAAVNLDSPDSSLILQRVAADDEFERMPPEGEHLTQKQIQLLKSWIAAGTPSPANEEPQRDPHLHWAFQPLADVQVPQVEVLANPIDAFIAEKLKKNQLKLSPAADPATLVRRLYLDMLGMPPTWDVVKAFRENPTNEAFTKLIEEVLASPHYGERWGQHWLDVVRYADTHGFEVNTPRPNAWPYRDYVIKSFNNDLPYNDFIRQQIAGDILGADAATGFLVAAAVLLPGQIGKDAPSMRLARQDSLDEMIVGTSGAFLGLTLGCARCHDHKFDPIEQQDYYSMQAFFAGVDYGDREIKDAEYKSRMQQADALQGKIDQLQSRLLQLEAPAFSGRTLIIDDEDETRVTMLKEKNGHGTNPQGKERGYRDDPGAAERMPNISNSRYTWWDNHPGEDVFVYHPRVAGSFDLWISWGVHGSGVHTHDARYILDLDGDLQTTDDQTEVACVDQYYFAGQSSGESELKPLWSGLHDAGTHNLNDGSVLIVRGGETGTGITADVIVLQEHLSESPRHSPYPQLRPPVNFELNRERLAQVDAKFVRFTSYATTNNDRYEPCLDELEVFSAGDQPENVALASVGAVPTSSGNYSNTGKHQLPHINDGQYSNDRSWISNEKGKGWVQLEFPKAKRIGQIRWGRDRTGKFKDRLSVDYQVDVSLDGINWKTVTSSADRLPLGTPFDEVSTRLRNVPTSASEDLSEVAQKLKELETQQAELRKPKMVYAGQFRNPDETHVLRRGDPEQPEEVVTPQVPAILGQVSLASFSAESELTTEQQRRLTLADWISDPTNPLTARVIVNRIWQYHFGTGLVATPNDFGLNGASPSHPELLDWLAQQFIENNWSIKSLHRLILTSQTWQQSNQIQPAAQKIDADCQLLWRYPSRRLEAEPIRDSLLFVSEELNPKMGGPGFDFFKSRGGLSGFPPISEFEENGKRRMIYAHKVRMEQVPVFGAFDCPDAGQSAPIRSQSTTAIQALNLFNSPFVARRADALAAKIASQCPEDSRRQCVIAYQRLLNREPTSDELDVVANVVEEHGLPTLLRVLFNSNEFLMLP